MRVIKLVQKDGQPATPTKDGHDHSGLAHRCITPYFGLYVATGLVAVGFAAWKLIGAALL